MSIYTITSNDTLTLNGHVFVDLSMNDVTTIEFPNKLVNAKTGKQGNTVLAQNASGFNANMTLRLMRGSTDDQYMQGLIAKTPADFPSLVLLAGTFVKRLGDGAGNVVSDSFTLAGGVIDKQPGGKENVEGDTSQGEAVYTLFFSNALRAIG